MTPEQQSRFDFLRNGSCVPPQYIRDYYGLAWPLQGDLAHDYEVWRRNFRRRGDCAHGMVARYELEAFMQQKRLVPGKWMAARIGMTQESFERVISRISELGLRPARIRPYSELASEDLPEEVVPTLPGLRFRTFSDHNSYCERLHADLRKVLDGLDISPLFCATSDQLEEYPRQFAGYFDCITLAPLSPRHQVWLDFHKPLALFPDRCSKLFYAEHREVLRPYCAGTTESPDLSDYESILEDRRNA